MQQVGTIKIKNALRLLKKMKKGNKVFKELKEFSKQNIENYNPQKNLTRVRRRSRNRLRRLPKSVRNSQIMREIDLDKNSNFGKKGVNSTLKEKGGRAYSTRSSKSQLARQKKSFFKISKKIKLAKTLKRRPKSIDLTNVKHERMIYGCIDYKKFNKKIKIKKFKNRLTAVVAASKGKHSSICVVKGGYNFLGE